MNRDSLKGAGELALGFVALVVLSAIVIAFLYGLVWVTSKLYPVVQFLASLGTLIFVLSLLPSAIFRRSRRICSNGMVVVSYLWGLALWMWCVLVLYTAWGMLHPHRRGATRVYNTAVAPRIRGNRRDRPFRDHNFLGPGFWAVAYHKGSGALPST